MPKKSLKKFLHRLLTCIYKVEVSGLENYHQAGKRVLIIANHTSYLDALLLGVFLPDDITFAINTFVAESGWLKPFLGLSRVFRVDPAHPLSLKDLIHHMLNQDDSKTVIFPEGRLTETGSLMKIYDGPGMVADKSGAAVLPIRIEGTHFTHFSKMAGIFRMRLAPKITMTILPSVYVDVPPNLKGKKRRQFCGQVLSNLMTDMMFASSNYQQSIFSALLEARNLHGGAHVVAEDLERKPLTYDQLITRSLVIGNALANITEKGENVGVFLPNSSKTLCVVLGLQAQGRVPAMLNYSTGSAGIVSACQIALVKTVLTSRRFIELGKLSAEAENLAQHTTLVYLEDLAANLSPVAKLKALLQSKTANFWYLQQAPAPDSPAVILFTSGSEGTPKGVVLSHSNIRANHKQIAARISFNPQDVVLNFLPMFHSFGFTVATLLPVLNGMKTFFYPTPLHYSVIPEMAYEANATIMFGTNTFFAAYGKKAHPYDFYSMRYVVAGAEKLQDSTRQLWAEKFGIRILEGYGATETAPVAAVNTPLYCKTGTVGRLLPRMEYRLEPVEGIEDAGRLHLNGPNIMLGYLLADAPGKLVPATSIYGEGWHDTGDIAHVDEDGFVSIKGRSKRFAKIGGEMVSLAMVEQLAAKAWPEAQHAAISLPDAKKGEQIILVSTQKQAKASDLAAVAEGFASICLPKKIIYTESIPLMATGKVNYPAVTELAKS